MKPKKTDYTDVSDVGITDEKRERLYQAQTECVVNWTNREGWPVGVMHRFVWHEEKFWVTCMGQRKRVRNFAMNHLHQSSLQCFLFLTASANCAEVCSTKACSTILNTQVRSVQQAWAGNGCRPHAKSCLSFRSDLLNSISAGIGFSQSVGQRSLIGSSVN